MRVILQIAARQKLTKRTKPRLQPTQTVHIRESEGRIISVLL